MAVLFIFAVLPLLSGDGETINQSNLRNFSAYIIIIIIKIIIIIIIIIVVVVVVVAIIISIIIIIITIIVVIIIITKACALFCHQITEKFSLKVPLCIFFALFEIIGIFHISYEKTKMRITFG